VSNGEEELSAVYAAVEPTRLQLPEAPGEQRKEPQPDELTPVPEGVWGARPCRRLAISPGSVVAVVRHSRVVRLRGVRGAGEHSQEDQRAHDAPYEARRGSQACHLPIVS
jgi:hypothetical protein